MSKKTLIILAHPNVKESIINRPIKNSLKNEENIIYKDLSEIYGNNDIDIEKEQKDLLLVDKIVFQFPLYWYNAPYILKKWIDSVFSYGFVYEIDKEGQFQALALKGKEFQMIASMGGSQEFYNSKEGLSVEDCLSTYSYTAKMLGMKHLETVKIFDVAANKFSNDEIISIVNSVRTKVLQ